MFAAIIRIITGVQARWVDGAEPVKELLSYRDSVEIWPSALVRRGEIPRKKLEPAQLPAALPADCSRVVAIREESFITAATVVGLPRRSVIFRHVLPNTMGPIVVQVVMQAGVVLTVEASLSFIGLGTQAPQPSWGNIIRDGLDNLFGSPWPIISAGLAITIVTLAINLIGDGVRDVLDPETRA